MQTPHTTPLSRSKVQRNDSASSAPRAGLVLAGLALVTASASAFAQSVGFVPIPTVATVDTPSSIVTADFDGDGRVDLAIGGSNVASISVIRNLGGGSFAPQVQYVVGSNPSSLAAADFDADGDLDLAVANLVSETISLLLNPGAGTFVSATPLPTSGMVRGISSADVSGDGIPDLVVAEYETGQVSVFRSLGSGAFAPRVSYAVGTRPFWTTTADLDADGDVDIAAAISDGQSVSLLFNQGGGTFAPPTSIPLGASASSIAAADLNGDNAPDLVVTASQSSPSVYSTIVLVNTGNGTFHPAVVYPTSPSPHSVRCADMNGDGFVDVVTASYGNTANVRLNGGNGVLGPQTQFWAGGSSYCLHVADFDEDGRIDIAVPVITQDRLQVLRNVGPSPGVLFCSGDGTGAPCPCGNFGLDGSGCSRASWNLGASLTAVGTASISSDTVVLLTTAAGASGLFFQGTTRAGAGGGVPFGDGLLCAGGTLSRLGTKITSGGAAQYPESADPSISVKGFVTSPGTRTYQVWYRHVQPFCTPEFFNLTNGYEITWLP